MRPSNRLGPTGAAFLFVAVIAYLLASLRIGAWLFLVPPFAGRTIPIPAKVVLSVGVSVGASLTGQG